MDHAFKCEKTGGRLLVEAPCFSRGELDFSPAVKRSILKWALATGFLDTPALKRRIEVEDFPER
jgi:hypothetical protein